MGSPWASDFPEASCQASPASPPLQRFSGEAGRLWVISGLLPPQLSFSPCVRAWGRLSFLRHHGLTSTGEPGPASSVHLPPPAALPCPRGCAPRVERRRPGQVRGAPWVCGEGPLGRLHGSQRPPSNTGTAEAQAPEAGLIHVRASGATGRPVSCLSGSLTRPWRRPPLPPLPPPHLLLPLKNISVPTS